MPYTFAGQNLGILRGTDDLALLPHWSRESHVVRRPYPGGNDESIQMLGFGRQTVAYDLHLTSAEYEALAGDPTDPDDYGLVQTEASLVLGAVTYTNVTLLEISGEAELINGDVRCRALFCVTSGA